MTVLPFIKSKIFYKHVFFAITLICILVYASLFGLDLYTRHNIFYKVPDFYGVSYNKADSIVSKENLKIKVYDSLFIKDMRAGDILDQHPKAGLKVKKHRLISVTICSSKPESIPFPNLKNTAFRQTLNTLSNLGFIIGKIKYQESEYNNLVLELKYNNDTIASGCMIEKGSTIDIILGKDKDYKILTPLAIGKNIKTATNILHYSYMNVGKIYYDKSILNEQDKRNAIVWKQKPEYDDNSRIETGSYFTLWITLNPNKISIADSIILKK